MKSLRDIWNELPMKSDKGDLHSYLEIYEELFASYRERDIAFMEVGLWNGASLLMFEKYFHNGYVCGIDCSETPADGMADLRPLIKENIHNIFIGDAESEEFIRSIFYVSKVSLVIEDAGHHVSQQLKIYNNLKPYLANDFIYVIEDIQDIDADRHIFENIDPTKKVKILDRRHINSRYDDVLCIIQPHD